MVEGTEAKVCFITLGGGNSIDACFLSLAVLLTLISKCELLLEDLYSPEKELNRPRSEPQPTARNLPI